MKLRLFLTLTMVAGAGLSGCDDFKTPAASQQSSGADPSLAPRPPAAPATPAVAQAPSAPAAPAVADPSPAAPASPEAQAIDAAAFAPVQTAADGRRTLIRAEVLLDRAHFSPGVIDGRNGGNFRLALATFERARGLAGAPASVGAGASLDAAALNALTTADPGPVVQTYVIADDDVKGPFLGTAHQDMAALAKLKYVGYTTPSQGLAEKFHMGEDLLRRLNPGVDFGKAGATILVARPSSDPLPPVARIEVDKRANQVRAFDPTGRLEAAFPATVGSTERPAPSGQWAVRAVAPRPDYTYDPSRLTFGDKTQGKLTIPPGPNNPVGSTWIDLTVPTFGIHGAPDPSLVGKTASHGCVRLTNWDAAALGKAVKKGVPVIFEGVTSKH
ncbi:MAG TPA: L,D-transpeptidase [Caulobacteraceae bacterium]